MHEVSLWHHKVQVSCLHLLIKEIPFHFLIVFFYLFLLLSSPSNHRTAHTSATYSNRVQFLLVLEMHLYSPRNCQVTFFSLCVRIDGVTCKFRVSLAPFRIS